MGGDIIFLLLVIFLVWPLFRFYLAMRKAQRQARDVFSQFSGNDRTGQRRTGGWSGSRKRRKKVIDDSIGEYVDFEEIETQEQSDSKPKEDSNPKAGYKIEQQVVDAEWEDIK